MPSPQHVAEHPGGAIAGRFNSCIIALEKSKFKQRNRDQGVKENDEVDESTMKDFKRKDFNGVF